MDSKQEKLDDNGFPEFEPVRFYDAPATLLTQLMDGETSVGRAIRTMISSESLSPRERDSYAQRIKKSYGGNKVLDTVVDVATNPLFWLLVMTSPIGRAEFAASGGKLFKGVGEMRLGNRTQKAAAKIMDMMRTWKLQGLMGMNETGAPTQLQQVMASRKHVLQTQEAKFIGLQRAAYEREAAKLGLKDLDFTRYAEGSHEREVAEKLSGLLHMELNGSLTARQEAYRSYDFQRAGKYDVTNLVTGEVTNEYRLISPEEYKRLKTPELKKDQAQGFNMKGDAETRVFSGDLDEIKVARDADSFNELRNVFPKEFHSEINYVSPQDTIQNRLNISLLDEETARTWLKKNNFNDEVFFNYTKSVKGLLQDLKRKMFYKTDVNHNVVLDAAGKPELDVDKMIRIWTAKQKGISAEGYKTIDAFVLDNLGATEVIDQLLPGWVKQELRKGSNLVLPKDVHKLIKDTLGPQLDTPYMPRNISTILRIDARGELVSLGANHSNNLMRGIVKDKDLSVPSSYLPRRGEGLTYDPNSLKALQSIVHEVHGAGALPTISVGEIAPAGFTASGVETGMDLAKYISDIEKRLYKSAAKSQTHVSSLDGELGLRMHIADSHQAISMHSLPISESTKKYVLDSLNFKPFELKEGTKIRGAPDDDIYDLLQYQGVNMDFPIGLTDLEKMTARRTAQGKYTAPEILTENQYARAFREDYAEAEAELQRLGYNPEEVYYLPDVERDQMLKLVAKRDGAKKKLDMIGSIENRPDVALLNPLDKTQLSMSDAITVVMGRENPETVDYFMNGILPHTWGAANPAQTMHIAHAQNARSLSKKFAESTAGTWIEKNGGSLGKSIVQNARIYGNLSGYGGMDVARAQGGVAGYLYATHLGFNVASATWNLMQPLQWASSWMGFNQILHGYGEAFKQIGSYMKERVKYGTRIEPELQRKLWNKHIRLSNYKGRDLLGMDSDVISSMDSALLSKPSTGKSSLAHHLLVEMPLKMFQMAERINRITVAEGSLKFLGDMGKVGKLGEKGVAIAADEVLDFTQLMQSMVNFSSNPATQLRIFQDGALSNRFVRMFLQYPLRSISNILTSAQIGEGTRKFGLQKFGGPSVDMSAPLADLIRISGIGAVTYEIGKNAFGIDTSGGLGLSAIQQFPSNMYDKGWIPTPPIIDIPMKLVHSIATSDMDELRETAFRLVPGGISIQKMLGALPDVSTSHPGFLQSQYADWKNMNSEGNVPVYKSDGSLQSFESPLSLVLRGVGADFKRLKSPQEASKFLMANRQEIIALKRNYKDAILGNNFSGAAAIENEYKKRFGVSMTVKNSEWDNAIKMREVGLSERLVDTLPSDVRGQFQQSLGGQYQQMGLEEGGLQSADTAKQRASVRNFSSGLVRPEPPTEGDGGG